MGKKFGPKIQFLKKFQNSTSIISKSSKNSAHIPTILISQKFPKKKKQIIPLACTYQQELSEKHIGILGIHFQNFTKVSSECRNE